MNEVKSPKKPLLYYYVVALLVVMLFNFIAMPWMAEHQIKEVDYNTFVTMTEQGEVGKVEIQQQDNRILFTSADEKTVYKTAMVPDDGLVQRLLDAGVSTTGEEIEQTSTLVSILAWVLPIIIFVALGQFMSRKMMEKMGGGNSMMFNMGKSNAKVYVKSAEGIRFSDVAGEDEAKENLTEVVNYLHDPSKYQEIGASMPKGILLVGPHKGLEEYALVKFTPLKANSSKLSLLLVFHVRSALCAVLCAAKRSKAGFGRRMRPASGCTCTVICSLGAHSPSAVATIGPRPSAARRLTCFARR